MVELLTLGLCGLFVGAGLSAVRRGAPRPLVVTLFVMAAVAAVLVVVTFQGNS